MADAVAYARFSTDMQDQHSIDTQYRELMFARQRTEIALLHNSPTTANLEKRRIVNISWRCSERLKTVNYMSKKFTSTNFHGSCATRMNPHFFKMRLEALGVDVVSVTEPLSENSAVSEFMERLLELSNKFQSDTTAMHVRSAMRELVRRGYWTGGPAPFGYSILEIVNREGYIDKTAKRSNAAH